MVCDVIIRRLRHVVRMEEGKISRRFVMGNSTTKDQQENQEKDGKTLSRGMHYRLQEYEDREREIGLEKNGGTF